MAEHWQRLSEEEADPTGRRTPGGVTSLLNDKEYREFLIRADRVDIHIHDQFSTEAHEAWREARAFFTAEGKLPDRKQKYDFAAAREKALGALHNELSRWRAPWRICRYHHRLKQKIAASANVPMDRRS